MFTHRSAVSVASWVLGDIAQRPLPVKSANLSPFSAKGLHNGNPPLLLARLPLALSARDC